MYKILIISLIGILFSFQLSLAEIADNQAKNKAVQKISQIDKHELLKHNKKKLPTDNISTQKIEKAKEYLNFKNLNKIQDKAINNEDYLLKTENIWVPGEFEESQAVLISWPSYAFDENGDPLDPFMDGFGWPWDGRDTLIKIEGYVADLFEDSPYPPIFRELINAIQPEAKVWIRLTNLEDSTLVKEYVESIGYTMNNYLFFNQEEGENSFWMRDCGPYGFYFGDKDSLGLVGMEYYPGRPIDNSISEHLANRFGYKFVKSSIETEGGNFMTDGWGNAFWSNVIYENNADNYGVGYSSKNPYTNKQVNDSMQNVFNLNSYTVLEHLNCDGGTGHIDLYIKFIDDETIVRTKYPEELNKFSFPDYATSKNNYEIIQKLNNNYESQYYFKDLDLPRKDDGTYPTSCNQAFNDARTYVNGLTVNKTFLMPVYSDPFTGLSPSDLEAVIKMEEYMPGYTIYPIDSRALSVGGGEIHCITMQIPAENPLKIAHKKIEGFTELKSEWILAVNARNHSGIKSSKLFWKKQNEDKWISINMNLDSSNYYSEILKNENFTENDTINYYIEVESNNGKTQYKPFAAPKGYYSFFFKEPTSVDDNTLTLDNISIVPNPANENTILRINQSNIRNLKISCINSIGEKVFELNDSNVFDGNNEYQINTSQLSNGIYYLIVNSENKIITKSLMVIR